MTNTTPHRATPEQWAQIERWAENGSIYSPLILELRARVEALEAKDREDSDAWTGVRRANAELRARVEALEAAQQQQPNHLADVSKMVTTGSLVRPDAPIDYIEEMRKLARRHKLGFLFNPGGGQFVNEEKGVNIQISTEDDRKDYFRLLNGLQCLELETNTTISKIEATMPSPEPPPSATAPPKLAPDGSLVERVSKAIGWAQHNNGDMSCAAIREVAAWLREIGNNGSAFDLEQEVDRG